MATEGHDLSAYSPEALPALNGGHVAIVVAQWNDEITNGLLSGAKEVLDHSVKGKGIDDYSIHHVPGSYELPLGAQFLFEQGDADAVICIGSVVRGETAHFDFVCQACSAGVKDVGLKYNKPCIFCVLTDDNIQQSRDRSGGKHGNKGVEAALAALQMLELKQRTTSD
jgi:6,7-dimethyl-8-ribityllumazine synthase